MKTTTIPVICGLSLAAMSAAGFAHWWTVGQIIAAIDTSVPAQQVAPASLPTQELAQALPVTERAPRASVSPSSREADASQKEFYLELLAEMKKLRTENRDLLDQMAETNRDLMKLEFRVDTHSESFRPLPVSEDRIETSSGDDTGVLPPRAQPVALPTEH